MITKKSDSEIFVWDPNAFSGKGYWFVLGNKGGFGRAASKKEANKLGSPKQKEVQEEVSRTTGYKQAAAVRKKSTFDLIAEKVMAGEKVGASFKKGVSEKFQASMTGLKEKFDPLNIISALTGRSKLGTALGGRLLGRKREDVEHFINRGKKTDTAEKLKKLDGEVTTVDVVGQKIYDFMVKTREEDKKEAEIQKNLGFDQNKLKEQRNQEIIDALLGEGKFKEKVAAEKASKTKLGRKGKKERAPKEKGVRKTAEPAQPTTTAPSGGSTTASVTSKAPAVPSVGGSLAAVAVGATAAAVATNVIAKEEGVSKDKSGQVLAYWDPPNQKTLVSIGYGHQIKPEEYKQGYIQAGDEKIQIVGKNGIDTKMTMEQAKKLLAVDIPKYEKAAKDPLGSAWNKLNDQQKSALMSYAYNTGSTASLVKMGLKDAIERGDMHGAAEIIREKGIRTAGGKYMAELDKRRRREADLFESGAKPQTTNTVPTNKADIDKASKENKDMKKEISSAKPAPTVVTNNNTTIVAQNSGGSKTMIQPKPDTSPLLDGVIM